VNSTTALACAGPGAELVPDEASTPEVRSSRIEPASAAVISRAARIATPGLALTLSFITILYCLLVFDGWRQLFRDSDTGWHIRTGERILRTQTLPRSDPYSFTRAGASWLDWEWGADVLTGAAHKAAGPAGVAMLFALAIGACSFLWVRLSFQAGGDFILTCLFAAPMLSTVNLHWLARPHVFGWLLLLAFILHINREHHRFTAGDALVTAALGAVWANIHGSFVLAPLIACLYAAAHVLEPLIWTTARRGTPQWFLGAAIAFSAGTLLNPYGIALHRHVIRYLGDSELLDRIGEFQSFNFHVAGAAQIVLMLAIAALGGVLALGERRLAHALVAVALMAMALRSARALPLVALIALPFANGAITAALRATRGLSPRLSRWRTAVLDYSSRLRAIDRKLWGAAPAVLALILMVGIVRLPAVAAYAGFPPDQFPVSAAAAVSRLPADSRILAPDKFGGYLIYRFDGRRPVFFDGRSDFYGAQFMKDYIRLIEARPGWTGQVQSFRFTHALLPPDYTLLAALEGAGWRPIYKDRAATLLAAPDK
jgi:hypothetical protein